MTNLNAPPKGSNLAPEPYRLRLPGPTAVPERVRQAIAEPVLAHRGAEFRAILSEAESLLRPLFGSANKIMPFASTGTGMMEAALVNVLAPGERLLVVVNGQFGERFVAIGKALGAAVETLEVPWGDAVDPAEIAARLAQSDYHAVVLVHNESSTGIVADLAAIGAVLKDRPTLLVVDSVSGLAGIEMRQDEWGVDVVVSASQKALMCPPGIGLASVSQKAWQVVAREGGLPRFYWDFRKYRDAIEKAEMPFTAPVSLVRGLLEALRMIHEEGVGGVLSRHRRLGLALRAGCGAIGLPSFAERGTASNTVSVCKVPEGIEGGAIVRRLYEKHRTVIAGARNKLAGKVIRIGTMGYLFDGDILTDIIQLEDVLAELGHRFERGAGIAAAAAALSANARAA
ncbi:MAG: alanine--glyoxylate aminotransferase family protein [Proteobacteria bacterium]|nr:alanine--glyoxylate aminotransferase family protein [Pseudomonadota bacterium]